MFNEYPTSTQRQCMTLFQRVYIVNCLMGCATRLKLYKYISQLLTELIAMLYTLTYWFLKRK